MLGFELVSWGLFFKEMQTTMCVYLHFWKDTPPSVNHNMVDKIWLTSLDSFRHNAKIHIYIYWTPPKH